MTTRASDSPRPDDTGPIEFIASMRRLRRWSGLTFRELADKAQASGGTLPASTLASALNRTSLPRREIVSEFARACGLDEASVARWVAARDGLAVMASETGQATAGASGSGVGSSPGGVPAMLPPDIPDFTGRAAEVAALVGELSDVPPEEGRPTALTVVAIVGMGGVGKPDTEL